MVDWDRRYLELAEFVGRWSRDPDRKVGAVIVGPEGGVRAVGYNGLPRGADEGFTERYSRTGERKYAWIEHAERNAIYAAARVGTPLAGCRIALSWFPCMDCARALVQVGITEILAIRRDLSDPRWKTSFEQSTQLLEEAGVRIRWLDPGAQEPLGEV